jgi:hypothetical protein
MELLTAGQDGRPRVGLRIVRSSPPPESAAAANSVDSPSECSARVAAVFHAEEPSPLPAAPHAAEPAIQAATAEDSPAGPIPTADPLPAYQPSAAGAVDLRGEPEQQPALQMSRGELLEQLASVAMTTEGKAVTSAPASQPAIARDVSLGIPPKLAWKHGGDQYTFHHGTTPSPHYQMDFKNRGNSTASGGIAGSSQCNSAHEEAVASPVFTKALDYKSCDHIMCLTKDMARHLFPPAPLSSAGL